MQSQVQEHAQLLVNHALDLTSGDTVVIISSAETDDLTTAVCHELGLLGAKPIILNGGNFLTGGDRHLASYLECTESVNIPNALIKMLESADAICHIQGYENPSEFMILSDETIVAHRKEHGQVMRELSESTYTLTQVPTAAGAQLASMGTGEFSDYVYKAILRDWREQRSYQQPIANRVTNGEEVHIVSDGTDLKFSIDGMDAINGDGQFMNLPGGEVYTAPVLDSITGTVTFDLPVWVGGRELRDIKLEFVEGKITSWDVSAYTDLFEKLLNIDEGANHIGEFGIGMNPALDQVTRNMALDEKMHGTIHFALGSAYEACVSRKNELNKSLLHMDMLVDLRKEGKVEIDGEPILKEGEFLVT